MARRKRRKLPKWRLKANWLLRELARIYYGKTEPYPLFEGENLAKAIADIMMQSILDKYSLEQEETSHGIECITEAFSIRAKSQVSYVGKTDQAREILIRSIELYKRPLVSISIMGYIFWMASQIERRLRSGRKPPYKPAKRIRALSYYENLPVLPID